LLDKLLLLMAAFVREVTRWMVLVLLRDCPMMQVEQH